MIQPPTTGPAVGASTATTPAIVVAMVCRRNGNSRNTAANTAGISVPPEKPCTTRHRISVVKLPLMAQAIEASVKAETATTNSQRMVSDARQEAGERDRDDFGDEIGGLHPAHLVLGDVSACWIVGSDVATTWMSRIAMNMPMHIVAKPIQVASPTGSV